MEFSKENMLEMIQGKKKFFLKYFLVSFTLFVISVIILMMGGEIWSEITYKVYGVDPQIYPLLLVVLMGFWKILIIQFTLVPFIALLMTEKCLKSKEETSM